MVAKTTTIAALCLFALAATARAQEPICSSPDVIFCEDFESTNWTAKWGEVSHPDRKLRDTNTQNVFDGQASLRVSFPPGSQDGGGWMIYWWDAPAGQTTMYIRWYVKYATGFNWGTWDIKMHGFGGRRPGVRYGPGAGIRPDGTWFDARILSLGVPNGNAQPRQPLFYYYHMNQQSIWGDFAHQNQNLPATVYDTNRWYCMELMVRPNDVGNNNGEMTMWVDNVQKGHYGGLTWRNREDVRINKLDWAAWVGEPQHSTTQYRWEDNIVVSRSRIGCLAGGATAPAAPRNLRIVG
jgi:hypothetical protein